MDSSPFVAIDSVKREDGSRRIEDDLTLLPQVLGAGSSGEVRLARLRHGPAERAVKTIRGPLGSKQRIMAASEAEIHGSVDHAHIVQLDRAYDSDREAHLVMEHLSGGDLFDQLRQREQFTERSAAEALRQMLTAVAYLHARRVAHLDIKLENFVYDRPGSEHLKLVDFGLAARLPPEADARFTADCGSLHFAAPEVLARSYTEKADVWSLGVVAYMLLCGSHPWSSSDSASFRMIREGRPRFSASRFEPLSAGAKDFVRSLLTTDPAGRPSAVAALELPWLCSGSDPTPALDLATVCYLRSFALGGSQLRGGPGGKLLLEQSLLPAELSSLRGQFRALDVHNQGSLSHADIARALGKAGPVDCSEADTVFGSLDVDCKGEVSFGAFIAAAVQGQAEVRAWRRLRSASAARVTIGVCSKHVARYLLFVERLAMRTLMDGACLSLLFVLCVGRAKQTSRDMKDGVPAAVSSVVRAARGLFFEIGRS